MRKVNITDISKHKKTKGNEKMKKYDDAITACDKYINICPNNTHCTYCTMIFLILIS